MKRLILVGGGHAHVEVLRQFAAMPAQGVEIVLVSPYHHAAYSGMLPGWIAGRYQAAECQVALSPLALRANARAIWDLIIGINLDAGLLFCANGVQLQFDYLSVDTGSRPATWDTPGADTHALAVKPIETFLGHWDKVYHSALDGCAPRSIAVVGTGAAGLEVATAMQQRLSRAGITPRFVVIGATRELLPGHNASAQAIYLRILKQRGINVRLGVAVARVGANFLQLSNENIIESDLTVWATGAGAPLWPRACGLATNAQGFIRVNNCLQSVSAPNIFAAGDVAAMEPVAHAKSGVYAVRAGPILASNLRRALSGQPLHKWTPQSQALSLISAGAGYAVASRGNLAFSGRSVWQWKDWIDRRWIRKYQTS